jgi:hypothetical protein
MPMPWEERAKAARTSPLGATSRYPRTSGPRIGPERGNTYSGRARQGSTPSGTQKNSKASRRPSRSKR